MKSSGDHPSSVITSSGIGRRCLAVVAAALVAVMPASSDNGGSSYAVADAALSVSTAVDASRETTSPSTTDADISTVTTPEEQRILELGGRAEPASFEASDGVLLRGLMFGDGDVGVVLSHMGRSGDSQEDWFGLADELAAHGYRVLTYDRRGVCSETIGSCSEGDPILSEHWQDVVGAVAHLEDAGAQRVVVVGASIGAMATWYAVTEADLDVAGVIWFAGVLQGDYTFDEDDATAVEAPKLFISSDEDFYGAGEDARQMYEWANDPADLLIVPGRLHGTDLLTAESPPSVQRTITEAIIGFVDANT